MCPKRPSGGGISIDKEIGDVYNISNRYIIGGCYGVSDFGIADTVPHVRV